MISFSAPSYSIPPWSLLIPSSTAPRTLGASAFFAALEALRAAGTSIR